MKKHYFLIRDVDGEDTYTFIIHCEPGRFLDTLQTALRQELDTESVYFPEIGIPENIGDAIDLTVFYDTERERIFEIMRLHCYEPEKG